MATTFANFFVIFCVVLLGFGAAYIGLLVEVGTFSMRRNIIGMVYYTYFQVCIHFSSTHSARIDNYSPRGEFIPVE
jgi:hypothetical protein